MTIVKMRFGLAAVLTALVFSLLTGCMEAAEPVNAGADLAEIMKRYPALADRKAEEAVVKRVVDGDTFETNEGKKVRLIGVNTPEKYGKVEYFGVEASEFSTKQLEGRSVYMFKDVSETDRYGRLLRYVFIQGTSEMYNETLLNEGYANVMTYPPDVLFTKQFLKLEQQARSANAGLWGDAGDEPGNKNAGAGSETAENTAAAECAEPTIKGNINAKKEKIYHVPGGSSYNQTKAEVMFCTEEEAVAAGFRKSAR